MSSFGELQGRRPPRPCRRCGQNSPAGLVRIEARAYGPRSQLKGGRTIASRSVSMCETCIVETFRAAERVINGE